ncbi:MAG: metallophosphoesterase [Acidobacteriota bacterium]|jgi:Icc-related predicted phosphoesterase|nr:metallophosphoesterase [Acidobacteriota bacterium]
MSVGAARMRPDPGLSFFVSDLHGCMERYEKLFSCTQDELPAALFIGGDLLPAVESAAPGNGFLRSFLEPGIRRLRRRRGLKGLRVFLIPGNDDPRAHENAFLQAENRGVWEYVHDRCVNWGPWRIYGYAFVPPTPFRLKDWERYDVSRFVDPGCTPPSEGVLTCPVDPSELEFFTIQAGLSRLTRDDPMENAICLFHSPPYQTGLDRAALDGKAFDHVPLDVHVGSMAIRRFIEARQPLLTLHGHVHESARLTGVWKESLGRTVMLSAAHDGKELCLVRFNPACPGNATRELI